MIWNPVNVSGRESRTWAWKMPYHFISTLLVHSRLSLVCRKILFDFLRSLWRLLLNHIFFSVGASWCLSMSSGFALTWKSPPPLKCKAAGLFVFHGHSQSVPTQWPEQSLAGNVSSLLGEFVWADDEWLWFLCDCSCSIVGQTMGDDTSLARERNG